MRKAVVLSVLLGVCLWMTGLVALASPIPDPLLGLWVNLDPWAYDITKLGVFLGDQGLMLQGYNYCSIADCAWEATPLFLGGYAPEQAIPTWGLSTSEVGDIKTVVTFRFEGDVMIVEYYLIWTDLSLAASKTTALFKRVASDIACTECLEQLNGAFPDELLWVPGISDAIAQSVFLALPIPLAFCADVFELEAALALAAGITATEAAEVVYFFCPELYEY